MHLSGTGIGDWLDIAVMPMLAPIFQEKVDTRQKFSHAHEKASPGYYEVTFNNGIKTKLTSTERVGFHEYTFPSGTGAPTVRIDLGHAYNWDSPVTTRLEMINDSTLVGHRYSSGWANKQHIYFALRTSQPIKDYLFNGAKLNSFDPIIEITNNSAQGGTKSANAQLIFDSSPTINIKVALSTTNIVKALTALQEIPHWNFDHVRSEADAKWDRELAKIKIETNDEKLKRVFYSALYHTAVSPTLYSDRDGEYKNYKGEVHRMPNGAQRYTLFSLWDTFRALKPLLTITQPEKYSDILNSMLSFYDENGLLPVWDLSTFETNTMTGYHAVPVLADAVLKNWPGVDAERAYQAMRASAFQKTREVPAYIEYGYIPQDAV